MRSVGATRSASPGRTRWKSVHIWLSGLFVHSFLCLHLLSQACVLRGVMTEREPSLILGTGIALTDPRKTESCSLAKLGRLLYWLAGVRCGPGYRPFFLHHTQASSVTCPVPGDKRSLNVSSSVHPASEERYENQTGPQSSRDWGGRTGKRCWASEGAAGLWGGGVCRGFPKSRPQRALD